MGTVLLLASWGRDTELRVLPPAGDTLLLHRRGKTMQLESGASKASASASSSIPRKRSSHWVWRLLLQPRRSSTKRIVWSSHVLPTPTGLHGPQALALRLKEK